MTDPWDERAQVYRESATHREGWDLDLLVEFCEAGPGVAALDVATGGGHVARRLGDAGCSVTTCDAAAGMEPDVVTPAESLPFDDGRFDLVTCRIAAHHFADVRAAVCEMARVSRPLVVIENLLFCDERAEEAEKLRDPTHVRAYSEGKWRSFVACAGLAIDEIASGERAHPIEEWLNQTGCEGTTAARVRELLAHVTDPTAGIWTNSVILLKTRLRD